MGDLFTLSFSTLFLALDPLGTTPIFVALTSGMSVKARRLTALRAVAIGGTMVALFGLAGQATLAAFGITIAAFRIAGGLMLLLMAIDMLFEMRSARREARAETGASDPSSDPSVFPLAIPLIAGPGTFAAMVLLVGTTASDTADAAIVYLAAGAVLAIQLALFLCASLIDRVLGRMGIIVATRIMGMLLAALAVQFIIDGLAESGLVVTVSG